MFFSVSKRPAAPKSHEKMPETKIFRRVIIQIIMFEIENIRESKYGENSCILMWFNWCR